MEIYFDKKSHLWVLQWWWWQLATHSGLRPLSVAGLEPHWGNKSEQFLSTLALVTFDDENVISDLTYKADVELFSIFCVKIIELPWGLKTPSRHLYHMHTPPS